MKRAIVLSLCLLVTVFAWSQAVPRFAKYEVGTTGCYVYMPSEIEFELTQSEDKSDVYSGEVVFNGFNFAAIVVEFAEPIGDDKKENVALLEGYLDFLQSQFGITASAGYGEGHTKEDYPAAEGVIDYWEDESGLSYAVKGWVDGYHIGVLMIYGEGDYPVYNVQDMFLNGFRFPGE